MMLLFQCDLLGHWNDDYPGVVQQTWLSGIPWLLAWTKATRSRKTQLLLNTVVAEGWVSLSHLDVSSQEADNQPYRLLRFSTSPQAATVALKTSVRIILYLSSSSLAGRLSSMPEHEVCLQLNTTQKATHNTSKYSLLNTFFSHRYSGR